MVALIFGTRGLILGANAEYGGWIGMFHTKVAAVISHRCMTFGELDVWFFGDDAPSLV
ncbi:hypothetical protein [uncultured Sphingobacterium sp.]|uniref:hypothetical protein n=1 Tax=uncultured Sphingobacterium sp. TaxID=182688 RepID=UPI0025F7BD1B|nr:hypothetical protein [uncultured Sphingobacterium sp.]